jgi:hypothetical protein
VRNPRFIFITVLLDMLALGIGCRCCEARGRFSRQRARGADVSRLFGSAWALMIRVLAGAVLGFKPLI